MYNVKTLLELVDPAAYAGIGGAGDQAPAVGDVATNAALVVDRAKTPAVDGVRAHTPEPTPDMYVVVTCAATGTYVFSNVLDAADYDRISFVPEQTSAPPGAVTVTLKLQWSDDATNWQDHVSDTNAAAAGEQVVVQAIPTRTWDGNVSAAYKPQAAGTIQKQGRYYRFGLKPSANLSVTAKIHYTLV